MKTHITLKSLRDLPVDVTEGTDLSAQGIPKSLQQPDDATGENFREMMRLRYTTPFVIAIPHHRWGLNE